MRETVLGSSSHGKQDRGLTAPPQVGPVCPELPFEAPGAVLAALESVGRTEDLRFSPDNTLLAIAGYVRNVVLLLRVDVGGIAAAPRVRIDDFGELRSTAFGGLHGLDWLDGETLATGNRDGWVSIIRVPATLGGRTFDVKALSVMKAGKLRSNLFWRPHSPGSLAASTVVDGEPGLLVCNNYKNRVTHHLLDASQDYRPFKHRVALRRGIKVPDGIAVSSDGRWVAVSSHLTHDVKVFDGSARFSWRTAPVASLQGPSFPHGLRFGPDGKLFVTDAGSPFVFWFEAQRQWAGVYTPAGRVRVMDEATFESRRVNPSEGGPKGIDVDRTGKVLAITCHQLPLRLYAAGPFVETAAEVV